MESTPKGIARDVALPHLGKNMATITPQQRA
ncbi:MAG: hypothetical protein JWM65_3697, partial [Sphingomonas bacterium]|nr:hypothetical protein [Sphingomonas bacterium]